VAAVSAACAAGGFAFTASNSVGATRAGDGTGAISGFVVSSVKYNLNTTNPSNIDSVTYSLDSTPPAGSTIKTQLSPTGSWYTCTNVSTAVTCPVTSPQATVAAASDLRVVIAQ
jgi:hypothetical protein